MAQGAPGANLPRLDRRLLVVALTLDVAEILCCGVPLLLWMRNPPWETQWLKMVVPLTLAVWTVARLRFIYLLRPLLDIVTAIRAGGKPKIPEAETARCALVRAPREVAVVHLLLWALVAAALPAPAVLAGECDPLSAAALVQLVLLTSAGLSAIRTLAIEIILAPVRPMLIPNLQGIRVFADRYRGALLAVGVALLGLWQTAIAFFATSLTSASGELLTRGMFVLWPTLVLGAYAWWRRLLACTHPIEDYFDLVLRAKNGKTLGRDDPHAVAAFIAAQRAPYALALVQSLVFVVAGLVAVAYLAFALGCGSPLAARLVLALILASLLAVLYQTLFLQQIMRPLIQHLGSRHALPLGEVRAPLGMFWKLGLSLTAVLFACGAFVWLFVRASSHWDGVAFAVGLFLVFGVVALLVRNVVAPLRALEERSSEMARGQLARPVPPWGEADEIGRLAMMFEEMRRALRDRLRSTESINVDLEREVRRRTEALEQRNAELHEALDKLRRAQDNLVRSEKLASMGRLVAGIAHEINNPVNAVINSLGPLVEVVKRIAAGEGGDAVAMAKEAEEILAVVQRGAARTKAIVQALHGYARGDDSVEREVYLARSVDDTLGLLQHRLRKVKVSKDIDSNVRIRGFPGQVDQVLMNLLTNAAQAIGDAGGSIVVKAHNLDDRVLLQVADDGPGIPENILPRIFDPFFTTKDVGEGSGLGLSIVHGIVERHGGHIDVESHAGQGTKFSISFPLPPASRPS